MRGDAVTGDFDIGVGEHRTTRRARFACGVKGMAEERVVVVHRLVRDDRAVSSGSRRSKQGSSVMPGHQGQLQPSVFPPGGPLSGMNITSQGPTLL